MRKEEGVGDETYLVKEEDQLNFCEERGATYSAPQKEGIFLSKGRMSANPSSLKGNERIEGEDEAGFFSR